MLFIFVPSLTLEACFHIRLLGGYFISLKVPENMLSTVINQILIDVQRFEKKTPLGIIY